MYCKVLHSIQNLVSSVIYIFVINSMFYQQSLNSKFPFISFNSLPCYQDCLLWCFNQFRYSINKQNFEQKKQILKRLLHSFVIPSTVYTQAKTCVALFFPFLVVSFPELNVAVEGFLVIPVLSILHKVCFLQFFCQDINFVYFIKKLYYFQSHLVFIGWYFKLIWANTAKFNQRLERNARVCIYYVKKCLYKFIYNKPSYIIIRFLTLSFDTNPQYLLNFSFI